MGVAPATYVFDFDSTLVTVESLDELAAIALAGHPQRQELVEALRRITAQGMAGELTFDASLHERLALFSPTRQHVSELVALLVERISPSVLEVEDWFVSEADNIYVVSGGFIDFILPVTRQLGLHDDHVFANRFIWHGDTVAGFKTDELLCQPQGKAMQLEALHLPRPIVMVGDGFTDYEPRASGAADEFWCFTETVTRPNAVDKADRVLRSMRDCI